MATKTQTFLIRADDNREAIMRLPVGRYGGITISGRKAIQKRFYDGAADKPHGLKYALNLEAFSDGRTLMEAIERYYKNIV